MKRWKKILLLLAAILLVAIACIISWSYGFRQGIRTGGFTTSMAELMSANQHMADQMANANCEGVKQTINDYLKVIEKYKDVKDGLITETTYYGDLMLGHIRLAQIEGQLSNSAEKSKHIVLAKEACAHRKWPDCSEEKLIWLAKHMEEKNPIACLSNRK